MIRTTEGRALCRARRAAGATALAGALLALAPMSANAALITWGSNLAAAANYAEAHPVDTAFWQTSYPDGGTTRVPADGQIRSVRIKGIALSNPIAGVPGGETMFHIQVAAPQPDGRFQVRNPGGTSGAFFLPEKGADPQKVTEYLPENLCARQGDIVDFNTVGGWDNGSGLYPNGTPIQIFSRIPNAVMSEFTAPDKTNNGDFFTPTAVPGFEVLMQMTVGTGPDGTGLCPGGASVSPSLPPPPGSPPPAPPPPAAPPIQKASIPASQRVTVSRTGKLSVSLFCRKGPARCAGTLRVETRDAKAKLLASAKFDVASATTGRATLHLNRSGRTRLTARGRRGLPVKLVATTNPGGVIRRSTLLTTLRKRGT
jgi:hypothetical protein